MKQHRKRVARQYGAVPFTTTNDGAPQIMLVTSRDTGRWIIPKGWPISRLKPHEVAAREAFEEAGLQGRIVGKRSVGSYCYTKVRTPEQNVRCKVKVFALEVDEQLSVWPEQHQRRTAWFEAEQAAALVAEPELSSILRSLQDRLRRPRDVKRGA